MHFMMSFRLNKTKPEHFGLIKSSKESIFINPIDNSEWEKREFVDLGWGSEIGFYKIPHLSFEDLYEMAKSCQMNEEFYGAISILLDDFSNKFLEKVEEQTKVGVLNKQKHKELFKIISMQLSFDENILSRSSEKDKIPYYRRWANILNNI